MRHPTSRALVTLAGAFALGCQAPHAYLLDDLTVDAGVDAGVIDDLGAPDDAGSMFDESEARLSDAEMPDDGGVSSDMAVEPPVDVRATPPLDAGALPPRDAGSSPSFDSNVPAPRDAGDQLPNDAGAVQPSDAGDRGYIVCPVAPFGTQTCRRSDAGAMPCCFSLAGLPAGCGCLLAALSVCLPCS